MKTDNIKKTKLENANPRLAALLWQLRENREKVNKVEVLLGIESDASVFAKWELERELAEQEIDAVELLILEEFGKAPESKKEERAFVADNPTPKKPDSPEGYKELIKELDELVDNWDTNPNNKKQLDCNWICVKFPKSVNWRIAKKAGAEKDIYWGWVLWQTSAQDNGSNLAVEVMKIAQPYGLLTRERQF